MQVTLTEKDLALLRFNDGTLKPTKFTYKFAHRDDGYLSYEEGGVYLDYKMLRDILDSMGVYDVTAIIVFGSVVHPKTETCMQSTWFGFGAPKEVTFNKKPNDLDLLILTKAEHDVKIKSPLQMYVKEYDEDGAAYGSWEEFRTVHEGLDLFVMSEEQFENSEEKFKRHIVLHGQLLAGKMSCKK